MVERALAVRHPLIVETNWLNLFPSAKGMQHDERISGRLSWNTGTRKIPNDAPLHPTVLERFELEAVLHFDEVRNYRPEALRNHSDSREGEADAPHVNLEAALVNLLASKSRHSTELRSVTVCSSFLHRRRVYF